MNIESINWPEHNGQNISFQNDLDINSNAEFYKNIVNSLPYPTCVFDKDLRYIYSNKYSEDCMNLPLSSIIGKTIAEVSPKEFTDLYSPLIEEAFRTGKVTEERVSLNLSGEEETILSFKNIPIKNENGEIDYVICTTEDLTEFENQRSEAMASARLASLGHMSANITHEINNPLQLIQLRLCRLEEMIKSEPEDTKSMLSEVESMLNTTTRINKIIESVRRQAKGYAHDKFSSVYVSELVEEAINYSRNLIDIARANLILDLKKDYKVSCNTIEIEQVIINLITNACDSISDLEDRWIKVSCSTEEDFVVILVQDSGNGIDKEIQKSLMKPFFTTKKEAKGTGLGLSLSKALIRRNSGKLSYLSEFPNTTFEIRLKKS